MEVISIHQYGGNWVKMEQYQNFYVAFSKHDRRKGICCMENRWIMDAIEHSAVHILHNTYSINNVQDLCTDTYIASRL
jgi:hypothetical protein